MSRPLLRAYSMASANHEDELEFFSIKVADGPLTSRLQQIKQGDTILVGRKATGTLFTDKLIPGKRLMLLSTLSLLTAAVARVFFVMITGGGPGMRPGLGPAHPATTALAPSLLLGRLP